jgi:hypothetical protein
VDVQKYENPQERHDDRPRYELPGDTGWGRHGKEMKEAVQSKDQEDETQKETGDDRSNFHGISFI